MAAAPIDRLRAKLARSMEIYQRAVFTRYRPLVFPYEN